MSFLNSSLGTDINSEWSFDENGDLKVVNGNENMEQAISNRLQTSLGDMDLFYASYGSFLMQFLGWRKNQRTLDFMKIEIENRLVGEPRLMSYNIELSYDDIGVRIDLDLKFSSDENYSTSLVLNEDGVDIVGD